MRNTPHTGPPTNFPRFNFSNLDEVPMQGRQASRFAIAKEPR